MDAKTTKTLIDAANERMLMAKENRNLTVHEIHEKRLETEQKVKEAMKEFLYFIRNERNIYVNSTIRETGYEPNPSQVEFEIELKISY